MSQHPLNIRPARMVMDGREWVDAAYAEALERKLAEKQRTQASHNHHFAAINDLYANLRIEHAQAPYAASQDAFRKHALIATGYCDVFCHVFESKGDMMAVGKVLKDEAEGRHGYALCSYNGNILTLRTPHSQSFKAMDKETFYASKAACLDWAAALLGVTL